VALTVESENFSARSSLSVSTARVAVWRLDNVDVTAPLGGGEGRDSWPEWVRLGVQENPPVGAPASVRASAGGAIRYSPRRGATAISKTPSGVTPSPPSAPVSGSSEISTRREGSPTAVPQRKTRGERGTSFSPPLPIATIRASGA
jgi:hypothetical protein